MEARTVVDIIDSMEGGELEKFITFLIRIEKRFPGSIGFLPGEELYKLHQYQWALVKRLQEKELDVPNDLIEEIVEEYYAIKSKYI